MVDSATDCTDTCYDVTVGGNMMSKLGMNIVCLLNTLEWGKDGQSGSIPMKTQDAFDDPEDCDKFFESNFETRAQKKALKILDNDHAKANLPEIGKECRHLSTEEKHSLLEPFQKFEDLFEG